MTQFILYHCWDDVYCFTKLAPYHLFNYARVRAIEPAACNESMLMVPPIGWEN